jgi:RNA polymerase sigma-70 factor (ECF subfamily)
MNPPEVLPAYTTGTPLTARTAEDRARDAELVRRMGTGDERAMSEFFARWVDPVFALALRMVRDRDEAEDLVEETFWQAWRQAARYDPSRASASTWLLTIARSRALDRLRSLRRQREESLHQAGDGEQGAGSASQGEAYQAATSAGGGTDPAHDAELTERRERVRAAMAELPADQREALELAYFGGLSQTEIAEQTGLPLGTVKTRMRLAAQKLRERLADLQDGGRTR